EAVIAARHESIIVDLKNLIPQILVCPSPKLDRLCYSRAGQKNQRRAMPRYTRQHVEGRVRRQWVDSLVCETIIVVCLAIGPVQPQSKRINNGWAERVRLFQDGRLSVRPEPYEDLIQRLRQSKAGGIPDKSGKHTIFVRYFHVSARGNEVFRCALYGCPVVCT